MNPFLDSYRVELESRCQHHHYISRSTSLIVNVVLPKWDYQRHYLTRAVHNWQPIERTIVNYLSHRMHFCRLAVVLFGMV